MKHFFIKVIETCESTNDEIIKLGKEGAEEGISILSFNQTNGRGRKNKLWISTKGNIFLSTLLKPKVNKKFWSQISLVSGLSVIESLIDIGFNEKDLKIKWPNDILLNLKKVSGILIESIDNFLVVGIGLNVNSHPQNDTVYKTTDLSSNIKSLKDYGLEKIANLILKKIYINYYIWEKYLLDPFYKKINNNLAFTNKTISFIKDSVKKTGNMIGVDENGLLKVIANNEEIKIISADICFIDNGDDYVSSD